MLRGLDGSCEIAAQDAFALASAPACLLLVSRAPVLWRPSGGLLERILYYPDTSTSSSCRQVDSRSFISTRSNVDLGYSKIFDGKYVAFGLITQGMDVVQRLNDLEVNSGFLDKGIKSGRPKQDIIIQACGLLQTPPVPLSAVTAAPLPAGDRGVYSGTRLEK